MSDGGSTLRRKIGTAPKAPAAPSLTPARVWRRAFVHGLARALDLEARVVDVGLAACRPEDVDVPEGAMIALLDGNIGYGVAVLDMQSVGALIEQQIAGRVARRTVPPRAVTATDAVMIADPLDRILAAHQTLAAELPGAGLSSGFRFAMRLPEARQIPLSLTDGVHDRVTIDWEPGDTGRTARMDVLLPRPAPRLPSGQEANESALWRAQFGDSVRAAEVTLTARLAVMKLQIATVTQMAPGDVLTVPRRTLGAVKLCDGRGNVVAEGRLGQSEGRKAVRLETAAAPDFAPAELPAPEAPQATA